MVEDDYDSELRYAGPPSRPCRAWTGGAAWPTWGAAPASSSRPCGSAGSWPRRPWLRPLVAAKWLADRQTPTLDQQVLTDFITGGHLTRHLRRARALYGARRAALVGAVARHLPACRLGGEGGGLQTPSTCPRASPRAPSSARPAPAGWGSTRSAPATGRAPARRGCSWATAPSTEPAIAEGVRRLALALKETER